MAYSRSSRFLALAVTGGTLAGLTIAPRTASAEVEIGAIAGAHLFSKNNELGVLDSDRVSPGSLRNSVLFGLRLGFFFSPVLGIEAEVGDIPTEFRHETFDVSVLTYRAHLVAQFAGRHARFVPFAVLGGGAMSVLDTGDETQISKDTDEMLYVGLGAKVRVANGWGLRVDARAVFPPSSEDDFATLDGEALFSVYKELGRKDIVVVEEEAPPPPPPPPADTDGDGLTDDADKCVDQPEDKDGFQDEDGCPDPDNDGDGVPDASDDCKLEPEDKDGFSDQDGCPDPDNDADGLLDPSDKCPAEAEDKDGFQDEDGCPDPDNDGDGVLDPQDTCPDQLETPNGFQDTDGCPDEIPAAVKKFTGVIKGINFKTNSDVILKSSNKTLDRAVKILTTYPDLKMEISGHTDDVGDRDYNVDLSQRRADSVKAYFVGKGIDESRLVAKGYGPDAPLIAKKSKAARAKNRRVEFKLISELTSPPPATQPTETPATQPINPPPPETQPKPPETAPTPPQSQPTPPPGQPAPAPTQPAPPPKKP